MRARLTSQGNPLIFLETIDYEIEKTTVITIPDSYNGQKSSPFVCAQTSSPGLNHRHPRKDISERTILFARTRKYYPHTLPSFSHARAFSYSGEKGDIIVTITPGGTVFTGTTNTGTVERVYTSEGRTKHTYITVRMCLYMYEDEATRLEWTARSSPRGMLPIRASGLRRREKYM